MNRKRVNIDEIQRDLLYHLTANRSVKPRYRTVDDINRSLITHDKNNVREAINNLNQSDAPVVIWDGDKVSLTDLDQAFEYSKRLGEKIGFQSPEGADEEELKRIIASSNKRVDQLHQQLLEIRAEAENHRRRSKKWQYLNIIVGFAGLLIGAVSTALVF